MIRIDPEFQALIPPLTADEYAQLEKNILKDGIRDPLVIWKAPGGDEILKVFRQGGYRDDCK